MTPQRAPHVHRRVFGTPVQGRPPQTAVDAAAVDEGDRFWHKTLLVLLLALLFYLPNFAQIRIETGIRGLNTSNLLCLLALFALWKRPALPSEPPPLKVPITIFLVLLSWGLVPALVRDRSAWVEDITVFKNQVFYLLLYFLYFYGVRDVQTLRRVMAMMIFVIFTSSYLGLRQAMDYGMGTFNETRRVAAPFGWSFTNANRSAIFFCIYLQLILAIMLFRTSRPWLRVGCTVVFVLGIISIFHTYSRQAYFIMALLMLVLALRRNMVVAMLAVVALYNYDVWVPQSVIDRVVMTKKDPFEMSGPRTPPPTFDPNVGLNAEIGKAIGTTGSGTASSSPPAEERQYDESTESRLIIWEGAGRLITSEPWGIGFNRFKARIGEYVPPSMKGKDAHNFYVLMTTESGLLAPIGILVLLAALFRLGLHLASFRDDEECKTLGIGFTAATLAVLLGNLYGSRFLDGDVMGLYWIFTAMVARLLLIKREEQRQRMAPRISPRAAVAVVRPPATVPGPPRAIPPAPSVPRPSNGPSRFF